GPSVQFRFRRNMETALPRPIESPYNSDRRQLQRYCCVCFRRRARGESGICGASRVSSDRRDHGSGVWKIHFHNQRDKFFGGWAAWWAKQV
ncbi:uncharacterized protein METZ01_LOCUS438855, partial [marine metagenome]